MRNHNGLIGRYPGADGMKTGFICASGFNVVASANRDGRRLITVVLGSPSANERTMKAADLFDRGFSSRATFISPTLDGLAASSLQAPPNMRSVICDRRGPDARRGRPGGPLSAESGPNLFGSGIFAFAGGSGVDSIRRTQLGPRAPVSPIRVWVGLNPPGAAELATQAAEEDAADKAAKASPKKANAQDRREGDEAPDRRDRRQGQGRPGDPDPEARVGKGEACRRQDREGKARGQGSCRPPEDLAGSEAHARQARSQGGSDGQAFAKKRTDPTFRNARGAPLLRACGIAPAPSYPFPPASARRSLSAR